AALLDEVPGGPLGDGLRTDVGSETLLVGIGPVLLGQGLLLRALGEPDGCDRGGDDDALDAVVEGLADDSQSALAGRDDELVRVLRLLRREGGGDMEHVVAALDHVVPVLVAREVGLVDGEMWPRAHLRLDRGVDITLAGWVPDRGPDSVAALEQVDDAPGGQVARTPCD